MIVHPPSMLVQLLPPVSTVKQASIGVPRIPVRNAGRGSTLSLELKCVWNASSRRVHSCLPILMVWEKVRPRVGFVGSEHTLTELVILRPGRLIAKPVVLVIT